MSKVVIFSAPSGAGKSTIINFLLKNKNLNLHFSISATSRLPRGQEKDGVEYFFLTADLFREKIKSNQFLEYEEVYNDTYYGTLKQEVQKILDNGENVIFDLDVVGGCNVKDFYGEKALSIFIEPPSIEELEIRLLNRGTDSPDIVKKRINKAKLELQYAPKFDVIVKNDNLEKAKQEVLTLVSKFLNE